MTYKKALAWAAATLKSSDSPHLDSEVLLAFVLNINRAHVLSHLDDSLGRAEQKKFKKLIHKRLHGTPVAYLTKNKSFYGHEFYVNKHVLVPRPDTECIVEFLKNKNVHPRATYIDIGTGSGCIAISIKKLFPYSTVLASDISRRALKVAKKNAKTLNADVIFYTGNLWKPYEKLTSIRAPHHPLIVIANLPYLEKKYITGDLESEPRHALFAKDKGLKLYKKLLKQIHHSYIKPDMICMEILPEQVQGLKRASKHSLPNYAPHIVKDISNKERYVILERKLDDSDEEA
ncbi:MAG: peptide chain release factor N(5)-glutamine methyltransferase [Patescibacteria group bacterium]